MDLEQKKELLISELIEEGALRTKEIIDAFRKVPREEFVLPKYRRYAYVDEPLPILENQTISQPYTVAAMTEALQPKRGQKILEIGAGSGYQAAILAELAEKVFSVERIRSLAIKAREILYELGYFNVEIKIFDGTYGWIEESPFDAIMVTAGAPNIPQPLMDQLAMGGRLVIPVGDEFVQDLICATKTVEGVRKEDLGGCRFVKLVGKYGWEVE